MPDDPLQRFEWRKSYSHVHKLPALGCAWEFVRRNPKFAEAWSALKPAWTEVQGAHGLKTVHAESGATPMSCVWASSPGEDSTSASVAWDAASTQRVLRAIALPPKQSFGGRVFDLDYVTIEKTLILTRDGTQNLLLRDGGRSLQIAIGGNPITEPACLLVDASVSGETPDIQLDLLRCWRQLQATGSLPENGVPPHPYARRAATVLLALDGYLAGASHRDIAIALLGEERVDRDWSDPREHLRDVVRRAITRGVALMETGYRMFLR